MFLSFYFLGVILSNHGTYGTPMEKHSKLFFKLSTIILILFEVLMYFHFINPPYSASGWFSFFWTIIQIVRWKFDIGFILGAITVAMVLVSYLYDRIMLHRHYLAHLPEYMPKKNHESTDIDDKLPEDTELDKITKNC